MFLKAIPKSPVFPCNHKSIRNPLEEKLKILPLSKIHQESNVSFTIHKASLC